ncbi:MAG: hypothetical protein K0M56_11255 [Kaistella sp.]|nr:hypothetical protein [Kaistella sp.]
MKNIFLSAVVATAGLVSCSTVSSIMQNTFPYNANFLVTSGSPVNQQLSSVSAAQSINQISGASANVKDIRVSNATLTLPTTASTGIFHSVKVYLSSNGSNEVLAASRENISDNVGSTLTLDVNSSQTLDNMMRAGGIQQRFVYVLKQSPTSDISVKTSINFSSVPITTP